jgi:hypothetical protein
MCSCFCAKVVELSNGTKETYDELCICTGSQPKVVPMRSVCCGVRVDAYCHSLLELVLWSACRCILSFITRACAVSLRISRLVPFLFTFVWRASVCVSVYVCMYVCMYIDGIDGIDVAGEHRLPACDWTEGHRKCKG